MKKFLIGMMCLLCSATSASAENYTLDIEAGVYHKTVSKWARSLHHVGGVNSTTYIRKLEGGKDRLHAAKHRDVVYWIPGTTDLSKPFIMLIWFHGHYGYDQQRTFVDRTLAQMVPKALEGKNFVLVLPEMPWSVHGRTPTKRNGKIWTKPGEFNNFVKKSVDLVANHHGNSSCDDMQCKPLGAIDYRIVGHSAGGSTISTVGSTGDLCLLNPTRIVWSDSTYGRWLERANSGCLQEFQTDVFINGHKSTATSPRRFVKTYEGRNTTIHQKKLSHKLIGNNIIKLSGILD